MNTDVDDWFAKIPHLIAEYSPNDIFNWDETGLFYTATRNASLVTAEEKKDRNLRGSKQQKQRITVLVGASMTGKKLPLIVVGKYEKPRFFKNDRVPVKYHAQKSAWMTASLLEQVLVELDRSMGYKNRQVLLFVDNCSAHPKIQPKNIRLVFFPPNVTSLWQRMDMDVVYSLKTNYKNGLQRRKIQSLNVGLDAHPINLLDAIFLLKKTWLDGVTASVIVNCFRKAGFSMNLREPEVLCITDQENEEAEPAVYTDDSLLTSAPMEGENITLPSASVTDPENPIEIVEGELVPVEITEVDEVSEVIVPSTREAYVALKTAQAYFF